MAVEDRKLPRISDLGIKEKRKYGAISSYMVAAGVHGIHIKSNNSLPEASTGGGILDSTVSLKPKFPPLIAETFSCSFLMSFLFSLVEPFV